MASFSEKKSQVFWEAARDGNLRLVKSLSIDPEVNLNLQDDFGKGPFYSACMNCHVDIVRYLLDFHDNHPREPIDYNLADQWSRTPFGIACSRGDNEVVEMLLEEDRIDVNSANQFDQTPLWSASHFGHVGAVKRLLASTREIDVMKKDTEENKAAAEIAMEEGYNQVAALIEASQKDPEGVRKQLRRELGYEDDALIVKNGQKVGDADVETFDVLKKYLQFFGGRIEDIAEAYRLKDELRLEESLLQSKEEKGC